jgi:hypothetical protein
MPSYNRWLIGAAVSSLLAAAAHLGCIAFGAAWYRALGAGEAMALMADAGHWYPTVVTAVITAVLLLWAWYALAGAGVVRRLPFLRIVLCAITAVYLLRGLAFIPLMPLFPGNSVTFWLVSSAICLAIGLIHLAGLRSAWARL